MSKPRRCPCTRAHRCDAHAAAYVAAYEAARAARPADVAAREDAATAREAASLRAFLDSLTLA